MAGCAKKPRLYSLVIRWQRLTLIIFSLIWRMVILLKFIRNRLAVAFEHETEITWVWRVVRRCEMEARAAQEKILRAYGPAGRGFVSNTAQWRLNHHLGLEDAFSNGDLALWNRLGSFWVIWHMLCVVIYTSSGWQQLETFILR